MPHASHRLSYSIPANIQATDRFSITNRAREPNNNYYTRALAVMSDAENFTAMTGCSLAEAEMYLEMAGGSMDIAVSLYFDQGGGGGAAPPVQSAASMPPFFEDIWGRNVAEIPPSWLQPLEFSTVPGNRFGLLQPKNGPCGVLAILQATLAVQCHDEDNFGPDYCVSDEKLAGAISSVLSHNKSSLKMATWSDKVGGLITEHAMDTVEALHAFVVEHLVEYRGEGALALIVYSAYLSRGPAQVAEDAVRGGGMLPLIFGPFNLCTTELMSLLINGTANGNVGSYDGAGNKIDSFKEHNLFGLLSASEIETTIPISDSLKNPRFPVFILHGGDHFTTAFCLPDKKKADVDTGSLPGMSLFVWNGLPPGGPRMSQLVVNPPDGKSSLSDVVAGPAPQKHMKTFYRPIPGTIDSIVQADPADKKTFPKQFRNWKYEVVLTVDDPNVQGEERPADMPLPKTFEQGNFVPGNAWRCRACYAERFKTMCFGMNKADSQVCEYCLKDPVETGFSIWLPFDDLPRGRQEQMERQHGPKVVTVLRTKWKSASVSFDDPENPPVV